MSRSTQIYANCLRLKSKLIAMQCIDNLALCEELYNFFMNTFKHSFCNCECLWKSVILSVQPLSVQHAMSCCSQLEATPLYFCHRLSHLEISFLSSSSIKTSSGTKAFSNIMMLLCHARLKSLIL